MYNHNKKKKKLSSAHRIASQQEQTLKKRPGDKYLDLTPTIHFCEPKFTETGTTKFKSLIIKIKRTKWTKSLDQCWKAWAKMANNGFRIALMHNVLTNN